MAQTTPPRTVRPLAVGDPVPWVRQRATSNPSYALDMTAGRYVVLCFYGTAAHPRARAALDHVRSHRALFDDVRLTFFGVSLDPKDESEARVREELPGLRYFWDFNGVVSRSFGVLGGPAETGAGLLHARWLVLDPMLRVRAVIPFRDDLGDHAELTATLTALPPAERYIGFEVQAPVLVIPNVFEPELCRALISYYEHTGGVDSGFMREVDGKTVGVVNYHFKRREDCEITDAALLKAVQLAVGRRVKPEIAKVHFFDGAMGESW